MIGCTPAAQLAPAVIAIAPLEHYAPMVPDPPPPPALQLPMGLIIPEGWYAEMTNEQIVVFMNLADTEQWFELRIKDEDPMKSFCILGMSGIEGTDESTY